MSQKKKSMQSKNIEKYKTEEKEAIKDDKRCCKEKRDKQKINGNTY